MNLDQVYQADCTEFLSSMDSESVDAFILDLPYGTTSSKWDTVIPLASMWKQVKRVRKKNAVFATTCIMPFTATLYCSNPMEWRYEWVWRKNRVTRFLDAADRPLLDYENIAIFYGKQPKFNPQKWRGEKTHSRGRSVGRSSKSTLYGGFNLTASDESGEKFPRLVLDFDSVPPSETLHPSQKPVPLYEYLILTYTNPGDLVVDFCCGSGSTLVAAKQLGRSFIGIDDDEEYCNISQKRIASSSVPLFVEA